MFEMENFQNKKNKGKDGREGKGRKAEGKEITLLLTYNAVETQRRTVISAA